ncbi:MAG: methyltransferase family protein [Ferruginibacter sp.]
MRNRYKALTLVILQFLLILILLLNTPLHSINIVGYCFIALSVGLVIWSVWVMQKSKIRIMPQPSPQAILITSGPYQLIRHPMYTSILLGATGLIINNIAWFNVSIFIALIIVLIIKLSWEEKMLQEKFSEYKLYMQSTSRIIPWVY